MLAAFTIEVEGRASQAQHLSYDSDSLPRPSIFGVLDRVLVTSREI
jgi:hypothetical protein